MNSHRLSHQRQRSALVLLAPALMVVILLSACGHARRLPEALSSIAAPPPVEADAAATFSPLKSLPTGDEAPWPYGQIGDTLAFFPPLSIAEGMDLDNAPRSASVYTYLLFGVGDGTDSSSTRPWRLTEFELLRLIDTYVLDDIVAAGENQKTSQAITRHQFLVPVYDGLDSLPLIERSAPDLAVAAREALADHLDAHRQEPLASRLRAAPGPFLISRTTANLVPEQGDSALLLTDLSSIGPEYLYSVVDAYDRPISAAAAGADVALFELRQRLARLGSPTAGVGIDKHWVTLLEPTGLEPTGYAPSGS